MGGFGGGGMGGGGGANGAGGNFTPPAWVGDNWTAFDAGTCTEMGGHDYGYCPELFVHYCCGVCGVSTDQQPHGSAPTPTPTGTPTPTPVPHAYVQTGESYTPTEVRVKFGTKKQQSECSEGFDVAYSGTNCAAADLCDCTDGKCSYCCKETVNQDGSW